MVNHTFVLHPCHCFMDMHVILLDYTVLHRIFQRHGDGKSWFPGCIKKQELQCRTIQQAIDQFFALV